MSSDWKTDRDALVEETMAFVASVSRNTPSLDLSTPTSRPGNEDQPVAAVRQPPHAKKFIDAERTAIKQRVDSFKSHQERLIREREAFADAALREIRPSSKR
jgi:hypothetical protein